MEYIIPTGSPATSTSHAFYCMGNTGIQETHWIPVWSSNCIGINLAYDALGNLCPITGHTTAESMPGMEMLQHLIQQIWVRVDPQPPWSNWTTCTIMAPTIQFWNVLCLSSRNLTPSQSGYIIVSKQLSLYDCLRRRLSLYIYLKCWHSAESTAKISSHLTWHDMGNQNIHSTLPKRCSLLIFEDSNH